jgi:hypothetical protein
VDLAETDILSDVVRDEISPTLHSHLVMNGR